MADVAVPSDGGERPVDVLSAAYRCLIVAVALVCASCGESRAPPEEGGAVAAREASAGRPAAAERAMLDAIGERLAGAEARPRPAEPTWPDDLLFHPGARLESVELMAVLEDEEGRSYSFARRFDRVSLAGLSAPAGAASGEDFAFEELVRLDGATRVGPAGATGGEAAGEATSVGRAAGGSPGSADRGAALEVTAAIERVTLGLAEASESVLAVRDVRLERFLSAGGKAGGSVADGAVCALEQRLREGERATLRFVATACPAGGSVGSLAFATSPTLAVEGTFAVEGRRRAVAGQGWTRRVWGEAPPAGGAVLFDRLLLEIDGLGLIEVERSKRRSGRGPRITTARLRRASEGEELTAEWNELAGTDEDATGGASEVPAAWRLAIGSLGVELTLVPPAGGQLSRVNGERAWRGAVRAEGSHEGVGFVELSLPEPPSANEEARS